MDKIIMSNMYFFGYHGVLEEENRLGQKFIISLELYCDLRKAGQSDQVEDTINYALVYERVKAVAESKTFKLLEALAEKIASDILEHFEAVKEIQVLVKKPEAPVKGIFDYFGVELRRSRNE